MNDRDWNNRAQTAYWSGRTVELAEVNRFERTAWQRTIDEQDAQIERLSRRVADAEIELSQTLRIQQAEQKAYLKLMNRICDALGSWVGPWDDAAVAAIKKSKGK